MKYLPPILDMTMPRPGSDVGKDRHLVPGDEYSEFWEAFYERLRTHFHFTLPVSDASEKINPHFGYFGYRFHPIKCEPSYFHLGLDMSDRAKTPIHPIAPGVLEYSGFGHVNGNYVFLSHPEIVTEDGFKLHSLYMHLKSCSVKFSSYQKMLRQISFNHYPNIVVPTEKKIGLMGSSGTSGGMHVHLHLQIEFRDEKGKIIVIDPAKVFGMEMKANTSAMIANETEFEEFKKQHAESFKTFGIRFKK